MKQILKYILRIVGFIAFLSSASLAQSSLNTEKSQYSPNTIVTVNVQGTLSGDRDWVGIYHKGASNNWQNVLRWAWVKKKGSVKINNTDHVVNDAMPAGKYEVRLFLHNSYTMKASTRFVVKKPSKKTSIRTLKSTYALNETVYVNVKGFLSGDKDWVGIFHKGASNKWHNVLKWNWVKKHDNVKIHNNSHSNMPEGEYEVRLFFHNSYKLVAKTSFKVKKHHGDKKIKIFVIGDSTVHNEDAPDHSKMGWANKDAALGTYMKNTADLFNFARSGASSKTYKQPHKHQKEYDWEKTKKIIKKTDISAGAYLFIQFGHNDERDDYKGTTLIEFYTHLKEYIIWSRNHKVIPVLITPVERRGKGPYEIQTHRKTKKGDYVKVVENLASDEEVLLLNLEEKSWAAYEKYDTWEERQAVFAPKHTANGKPDITHFSPSGAKIVAGWVKELICDDNNIKYDKKLCLQFKPGTHTKEKDEAYLYQNLQTKISSTHITIKNDDVTLLDAPRSLFNNSTNTLQVTHSMQKQTGGFDIVYTVKNKTAKKQKLDIEFTIPGIHFGSNSHLNVLNTKTYFYPIHRDVPLGKRININDTAEGLNQSNYPRAYSPVIVAHNHTFSVGTAIHTSYIKNRLSLSQTISHTENDTWRFNYKTRAIKKDNIGNNSLDFNTIKAHKSIQIKISVRFAAKRYWLLTLSPYKHFFNKEFSNKHITIRDTKPIIGLDLSYGQAAQEGDSRGYNYYTDLGKFGFDGDSDTGEVKDNFTHRLKKLMKNNNYKRVMLWAMGGQFNAEYARKFNIPPQFMSNIPDNIINSFENTFMDAFKDSGIDYGFWWGRSGQIPYKNEEVSTQWNPDKIKSFDLHNHAHKSFALNELKLAHQRGAKEIGLDAFTNMKVADQLPWLRKMKHLYPEIKFWEESVQSDYLHTESALFLQPNIKWANRDKDGSNYKLPPLLTNYLNPKAEVLIWLKNTWGDGRKGINRAYLEKLTKMGYTPLLIPSNSNIYGKKPFIDISGIDRTLYTCHDGIDNNGDGKTDWPYDDSCDAATDNEN